MRETFERFVAAINSHDVDALAALMTEDHLFVDSLGNRIQGAVTMTGGWRGYFAMCPDYWIRAGDVLRHGQVAEWHVFADNKPVYEILAKRQR